MVMAMILPELEKKRRCLSTSRNQVFVNQPDQLEELHVPVHVPAVNPQWFERNPVSDMYHIPRKRGAEPFQLSQPTVLVNKSIQI